MTARIHLFSTDLAPARISELARLLSPAEGERAGRFQFEADRARYVASRGTLRLILSGYLDRPAESIAFVHGLHGKRVVVQHQGESSTQ